MAVANQVAGVSVSKQNEVNCEVGLISPHLTTMQETNHKLKTIIFDLFKSQLLLNCKEHVTKAQSMPDYGGDIMFADDNVAHSYCREALAMDGAGNTRAYNH